MRELFLAPLLEIAPRTFVKAIQRCVLGGSTSVLVQDSGFFCESIFRQFFAREKAKITLIKLPLLSYVTKGSGRLAERFSAIPRP